MEAKFDKFCRKLKHKISIFHLVYNMYLGFNLPVCGATSPALFAKLRLGAEKGETETEIANSESLCWNRESCQQ